MNSAVQSKQEVLKVLSEHAAKFQSLFMALSFLLEELLHRRVELVTPEALSPYLGPSILKEAEYVAVAA